jgi:hypothetical protein
MEIENTIDLLEDICGKYKDALGESFLTSDLGTYDFNNKTKKYEI